MEAPVRRKGIQPWKWALAPLMVVVTVLAYTWAQDLKQFPDPPTARIIFWHVPPAMLGLLWFWVGCVHGARYLFGKRQGDAGLDTKSKFCAEVGLVCTILATVTGMVFAYRQWNTPWNWDPKQVGITILILVYLAYFGLRASIEAPELRARISAAYSILGAVSSIFLTYIIPNLPQVAQLHPEGTTILRGLDPKWRTIYWLATLGFFGITYWMYELRLRVTALETSRAGEPSAESAPALQAVRRPV
jgi:heme exporter protein C